MFIACARKQQRIFLQVWQFCVTLNPRKRMSDGDLHWRRSHGSLPWEGTSMGWSVHAHEGYGTPPGRASSRVNDVVDAASVLNGVARTFSSPIRVEVLLRLAAAAERSPGGARDAEAELDVSALTALTGVSMSDVSKALHGLRDAALVRCRVVGARHRYAIADGVQLRRVGRTGALSLAVEVAEGVVLSVSVAESIVARYTPVVLATSVPPATTGRSERLNSIAAKIAPATVHAWLISILMCA